MYLLAYCQSEGTSLVFLFLFSIKTFPIFFHASFFSKMVSFNLSFFSMNLLFSLSQNIEHVDKIETVIKV